MDTEMYIKILLMKGHKGIKVIPDIISHYRIHEASKTGSQLDKFHGDTSSIFHQLALSVGDKKNANKIENIIAKDQIVRDYKISLPFKYEVKDVKSACENRIYNFLNIYYNDKSIANKDIKGLCYNLDSSLLEPTDAAIAEKIKFRVKWLPWLRILR
jgi:hypothetical protein